MENMLYNTKIQSAAKTYASARAWKQIANGFLKILMVLNSLTFVNSMKIAAGKLSMAIPKVRLSAPKIIISSPSLRFSVLKSFTAVRKVKNTYLLEISFKINLLCIIEHTILN